jgi:hypothetical protein
MSQTGLLGTLMDRATLQGQIKELGIAGPLSVIGLLAMALSLVRYRVLQLHSLQAPYTAISGVQST